LAKNNISAGNLRALSIENCPRLIKKLKKQKGGILSDSYTRQIIIYLRSQYPNLRKLDFKRFGLSQASKTVDENGHSLKRPYVSQKLINLLTKVCFYCLQVIVSQDEKLKQYERGINEAIFAIIISILTNCTPGEIFGITVDEWTELINTGTAQIGYTQHTLRVLDKSTKILEETRKFVHTQIQLNKSIPMSDKSPRPQYIFQSKEVNRSIRELIYARNSTLACNERLTEVELQQERFGLAKFCKHKIIIRENLENLKGLSCNSKKQHTPYKQQSGNTPIEQAENIHMEQGRNTPIEQVENIDWEAFNIKKDIKDIKIEDDDDDDTDVDNMSEEADQSNQVHSTN
jgi:hypothetical protein